MTSLFQRIFGTTALGVLYLYGQIMGLWWWSIVLYGPFLYILGVLTTVRQLKKRRELQKHMKWSKIVIDGHEFVMMTFDFGDPEEKENGNLED